MGCLLLCASKRLFVRGKRRAAARGGLRAGPASRRLSSNMSVHVPSVRASTTGAGINELPTHGIFHLMYHIKRQVNEVPGATTWSADFLNREGESREFLGLWFAPGAVYEAKKRRVTQVTTCSFPCGKWLHMIQERESPSCELCRRERRQGQTAMQSLPEEHTFKAQDARQGAEEECHWCAQQVLEVLAVRHHHCHGKADCPFIFCFLPPDTHSPP